MTYTVYRKLPTNLVSGFFPAFEKSRHGTTHHNSSHTKPVNVSKAAELPNCQGQIHLTVIRSAVRPSTWYCIIIGDEPPFHNFIRTKQIYKKKWKLHGKAKGYAVNLVDQTLPYCQTTD